MEKVEVLYYKWCKSITNTYDKFDYIIVKDSIGLELVYCKVEKWVKWKDEAHYNNALTSPLDVGIRTIPVRREELESI